MEQKVKVWFRSFELAQLEGICIMNNLLYGDEVFDHMKNRWNCAIPKNSTKSFTIYIFDISVLVLLLIEYSDCIIKYTILEDE